MQPLSVRRLAVFNQVLRLDSVYDPAAGSIQIGAVQASSWYRDRQMFAAAEPLAIEYCERMQATPGPQSGRVSESIEALMTLYVAWHEVEPHQGYDAKAAEWRAKLPTTQPAAQSTPGDGGD